MPIKGTILKKVLRRALLVGLLGWSIVPIGGASAKSLVAPPYFHSYGIRKATQQHLALFLGPLTRFDNPQGIAVTRLISRDDPASENDDDEVVVYGVNGNRHQIIYNTSMYALSVYGGWGSGNNQFKSPRGIIAEPHGYVFVADSGNNRIVRLFNQRKTLRWLNSYYGNETGGLAFSGPSQVGLDEDCHVYVSDTRNNRIVVFDTAFGSFRSIVGVNESRFINGPTTLAVADGRSRFSYYRDECLIFCADDDGARLWKLDAGTGAVLGQIRLPPGNRAAFAAVDYYHNLWVTDSRRHCILKYDHNLKLLDVYNGLGNSTDLLKEPRGIAIWKRFGQTFVAEKEGAQYFWIGTDSPSRRIKSSGQGRFELEIGLTEPTYLSIWSESDKDTCFYLRRAFLMPPLGSVPFESLSKAPLSKGCKVFVRIEPTYSSYTYRYWDYPEILP